MKMYKYRSAAVTSKYEQTEENLNDKNNEVKN